MTRLGVPGRTNARQHTELSALNEISRKLDRLKQLSGGGGTPIVGFSTEVKQDVVISRLQSIIDKVDFEIVESLGVDSDLLTPVTLNTVISDSLGIGGGAPPVITTISTSEFSYSENNRNYEIIVPITGGFPLTGLVELYINYESITPNSGIDGGTFILQNDTRTLTLDSTISSIFSGGNNSQTLQVTFDNTITGFTSLNLILRSRISSVGYPANYKVTILGSTPNGFSVSDLITRQDRYENNLLVSTEYLTANDLPYTLMGTFLRDSNRSTETNVSDLLNQLNGSVSTSTNQLTQIEEVVTTNSFLNDRFFGYELDLANSNADPWLGGFPITINNFIVTNGYESISYNNTVTLSNQYEVIDYLNTHQNGFIFSSEMFGSTGDVIYVNKGNWDVSTNFRLELEEDVRGTLEYAGMVDFPVTFYDVDNAVNVNDLGVLNKILIEISGLKNSVKTPPLTLDFIEYTTPGNTPINCKTFSILFWGTGGTFNGVSVPDGFIVDFQSNGSNFIKSIPFTIPTVADSNGFQRVTISITK